jgi:membrane protein required for colicin V production
MVAATSTDGVLHAIGTLSTVDYAVIGLVLLSVALGFWTGFIWQFVRIACLAASVWASWALYPTVADLLSANLAQPARNVIAAAAVFVAAMLACYLLTYLFHGLIDALKPEMPDRLLGAVFGLIKGVVLVGFIAFLLMRFLPADSVMRGEVEGSKGAVAAATCVRTFINALPVHQPSGGPADQAWEGVPNMTRGWEWGKWRDGAGLGQKRPLRIDGKNERFLSAS